MEFSIKEVETVNHGRCFTLNFNEKLGPRNATYIKLKRTFDLMIYIHSSGEEFWLHWIEFPTEVSTLRLNIKTDIEAIMSELSFTEMHTEYKDKDNSHCIDYNAASLDKSLKWETLDFIECCRKNFQALLLANISCSIVGLKPFMNAENPLHECQSKKEAAMTYSTYWTFLKHFRGNYDALNCPLPCFIKFYRVKQTDLHKNSLIQAERTYDEELLRQHYSLSFSYDSFKVEEKVETLVYDLGSFLTSIGGNLGLFLGFSCFSILVSFIDMLKAKF